VTVLITASKHCKFYVTVWLNGRIAGILAQQLQALAVGQTSQQADTGNMLVYTC